jgi:hypothetical protein
LQTVLDARLCAIAVAMMRRSNESTWPRSS